MEPNKGEDEQKRKLGDHDYNAAGGVDSNKPEISGGLGHQPEAQGSRESSPLSVVKPTSGGGGYKLSSRHPGRETPPTAGDRSENPLTLVDSQTGKNKSTLPRVNTEGLSARKVALLLTNASKKKTGEQLKARYSELLLNLTLVASILAAFAYDAFESQTEVTQHQDEEKYFVSFCILSVLSNMLSIIFSLYLWDKVAMVEDEHMLILAKHYKNLLRAPRIMIMLGGVFFLVLIFIQGWMDYGEYVAIEFTIIYFVGFLVAVAFFLWAKRAQNAYRQEILAEFEKMQSGRDLNKSVGISQQSPPSQS